MTQDYKSYKCIQTVNAECDYYKEVHQIDVKFQKLYDEINKQREAILSGAYEPSGAEVIWTNGLIFAFQLFTGV